jgi:hypothetical protein
MNSSETVLSTGSTFRQSGRRRIRRFRLYRHKRRSLEHSLTRATFLSRILEKARLWPIPAERNRRISGDPEIV